MIYQYEKDAVNGEPVPKNLPLNDKLKFIALRGLYASYQAGKLQKAEAQLEKKRIIREIDEPFSAREAERRRWEENQERTFAADRALQMYQSNRSQENADELAAQLNWMHGECAKPALLVEHGAKCPVCGKFFEQAHSDRKPVYCEDCGCRLKWKQP